MTCHPMTDRAIERPCSAALSVPRRTPGRCEVHPMSLCYGRATKGGPTWRGVSGTTGHYAAYTNERFWRWSAA